MLFHQAMLRSWRTVLLITATTGLAASLPACIQAAEPDVAAAATPVPDAVTPDGGRYYGPLREHRLHGIGRLEWSNGAVYQGQFEQGLFYGKGSYKSADGDLYEGQFRLGAMHGQGRYTSHLGPVYTGQFVDSQFTGKGRQTGKGFEYEGDFKQWLFDGEGKLLVNGDHYQGAFKAGKYHGKGKLVHADGRHYRGDFVDGLFEGKGRYESADGQVYEGEFSKGNFEGQGSYRRKDGTLHVGQFKNWRPEGPGVYTSAEGDVYEGNFVKGELAGKGSATSTDGSVYHGEFKEWRFDGQGSLRNAAGDEYVGRFKYGMYEGEGVLTYAKPQKDGRLKDAGTWSYGVLDDPAAAKLSKLNVETALYTQRALLDTTLAALLPREPGKINMYLLAVGGNGAQEVFRRETEYVQQQFDRHFGTAGRSVVLVNSRTTVATRPMATLTSIRESLAAIAARMDKDNDILFLFLTSHGSRTHEFQLDQNGMDLHSLEAQELGKLLKASGIRWKVTVISACYSGGFIDPLKDDHGLIITAARGDRTSFGCADDNDFTYFSEALFKDAILSTSSFGDAFHKARKLVAAREDQDVKAGLARRGQVSKQQAKLNAAEEQAAQQKNHSEPQYHHAAPIDQYLKKWRAQLPAASGKPK
ncbi:MAG: C13 family peptidase [Pseudomonadota bacterium]